MQGVPETRRTNSTLTLALFLQHLAVTGRTPAGTSNQEIQLVKTMLTAACAAMLVMTSQGASAAEPDFDTRTVKVDYSSLDLTNASGVAALETRVRGTIHEVCGGPSFDRLQSQQQQACERAARASASRQIQDAVVSARQLPRNGTAVGPLQRRKRA